MTAAGHVFRRSSPAARAQRVAIARALANRPRIVLAGDRDAAVIAVTRDEKIFDRFDDIHLLRDGRFAGREMA
ncbi:hypothetical protein ACUN0C_11495 [Faunimonas sp. B44]|uniref:hypothetical protein n=1 Tax=Faunimonas sp. B44 TaxID=3461493 RepID=UPI004043E837